MLLNRASGWRKRFIVDVGTLKIIKLSKKGTGPLFFERKEEKEGNLSRTATALPRVVETRPSERDCCAHILRAPILNDSAGDGARAAGPTFIRSTLKLDPTTHNGPTPFFGHLSNISDGAHPVFSGSVKPLNSRAQLCFIAKVVNARYYTDRATSDRVGGNLKLPFSLQHSIFV